MRILFTIYIALMSFYGISQIQNAEYFLDFALSGDHEQAVIMGSDWIPIESEAEGENYWRYYEEEKYVLTLKDVYDAQIGANYRIATVTFNKSEIFKEWKNDLENSGLKVVQDPNGKNKWAVMDEDDYIIYMEKRQIKDIWVYEISIMIESGLSSEDIDTNPSNPFSEYEENTENVLTEQEENSVFVNELPEDKNRNGGVGSGDSPKRKERQLTKSLDTTGLVVNEKCKISYHISVDSQGKIYNPQLLKYEEYIDESTLTKKQIRKRNKSKEELLERLSNKIKYTMKFEEGYNFPTGYKLNIEITVNPTTFEVNYKRQRNR